MNYRIPGIDGMDWEMRVFSIVLMRINNVRMRPFYVQIPVIFFRPDYDCYGSYMYINVNTYDIILRYNVNTTSPRTEL